MPLPVYSTRFIAAQNLTGDSGVIIGAGKLAVIRTITVFRGATAGAVALTIYAPDPVQIFTYQDAGLSPDSAVWEGRAVVYQGEKINAHVSAGGSADVTISGYLLTLP